MTCQHCNLHPPTPSYTSSTPSSSLCPPPLPPSITDPDGQEWPCMTNKLRSALSARCSRWNHRFLLCEIQTVPLSHRGLQLRPSPFRQAPLNLHQPQLSPYPKTWPLTSYLTPCSLNTRSWESTKNIHGLLLDGFYCASKGKIIKRVCGSLFHFIMFTVPCSSTAPDSMNVPLILTRQLLWKCQLHSFLDKSEARSEPYSFRIVPQIGLTLCWK